MRRLVLLLLVLACCSFLPIAATDWHFDATLGVNDDTNLESRIDWHVEDVYFEINARQTDYLDPSIDPVAVSSALKTSCLSPAALGRLGAFDGLEWGGGLQWNAGIWWRAFEGHGPTAHYTRISDLDETFFVGWHFSIGSE